MFAMARLKERPPAHAELAVARTENGIELPVLDITHPRFASATDEGRLDDLRREAQERMRALAGLSDEQKSAYREQLSRSLILGPVFRPAPDADYLSGMSTYVFKLGPELIGGGPERAFDRQVSMGIGGVAARMRLRDLCALQADLLIPQLEAYPGRDVCLVSIAGGAASDSVNTLILVLERRPDLLNGRTIEIDVLDVDAVGLRFAGRCVEALGQPGHRFHGLDVTLNAVWYDWRDTRALADLLSRKRECIVVCASEGGLFEYGGDGDIVRNLNALHDHAPAGCGIVGTFVHEEDKVDRTVPAMVKAANAGLRFLGMSGVVGLLRGTSWRLTRARVGNPIYGVFVLQRGAAPGEP